ncbi:MAG: recombinase family protein [Candidatus Merdivicinus sp.]|jgi:site-specific DNA recombinase
MARTKRFSAGAVLGTADNPRSSQYCYRTGIYVRLSVEDSGKKEGDSLQNQEMLLRTYVEAASDLQLERIYIDNGFSGTNFERPAFERMIGDARMGQINCIVVKDLSRLGRNYLEAGNYLEQIFPFLGIRFISVNDGYDSSHPEFTQQAWLLPLKNFINEGYARDISRKVSSALTVRKSRGMYTGKYPPYGYRKDPHNRNHLIPDPNTCGIVRRIFLQKASGEPMGKIARCLNEEGIPSPSRYLWQQGIAREKRFASSMWEKNTILRLLKNPIYIGTLVYGKEEVSFAKGIPRHTLPETAWKSVSGCQEALIERELFDQIQQQLAIYGRRKGNEEK